MPLSVFRRPCSYYAYMRLTDTSAVVLQDVTGIGDPSGRGEAFSFIREITIHRKHPGAAGGGLRDKREGTDRDSRALTMHDMAELLRKYGVAPAAIQRMKRWERVQQVRKLQNEQLSSLRSRGGDAAAAAETSGLLYAGESKLSVLERERVKKAQAAEIQRRQTASLSNPEAPPDEVDDEVEGDEVRPAWCKACCQCVWPRLHAR